MSSDPAPLLVRGGYLGVTATLSRLDDAATALQGQAHELLKTAFETAELGRFPVLWPSGAAAILRAAGWDGLLGAATEVGATARRLRATAAGYRASDRLDSATTAAMKDLLAVQGVFSLPLTVPVLAGVGWNLWQGGVDPATVLDAVVFSAPELVDVAGGGLDAGLTAAGAAPGMAFVLAYAAARAGVRWPPASPTEATAIVEELGSWVGALDERTAYDEVTITPSARTVDPFRQGHAATGLAGFLDDAVDLGAENAPSRVRVTQIPQADGSSAWVLHLPGTQEWGPVPGDSPFDLTTDIDAMAGRATLEALAARRALEDAQRRAGRSGAPDPVLLVGHSQGGIVAAAMASDSTFRAAHPVGGVVTAGSPIARFPIPADVPVLSLEHAQDPVPRLDGIPNPDRPTWVTITADLAGTVPASAAGTHAATQYRTTAGRVDGLLAQTETPAALAGVGAWLAPYVGGARPATVTDYSVRRSRLKE